MQIITIEGRAGADSKLNTTTDGQTVLSLNVAVNDPNNREQTNWFRCSIWGKRATTLQQYLVKGTKIFAVGTLSIGEYEGKAQYNLRVNDISFYTQQRQGEGQVPQRHTNRNDLDDDVPF
jgi:single-strand DNA-binding protein